jgi:two-component system NtrC family sensor kinase
MKNFFRHPEKSIAAKLIIATGILIVVLSIIFWYAILLKQEKDVISIAVRYANSFTDFIKDSTRHSMLNVHRDLIQQTLEDISIAEGVERVRIFNHAGNISYSTFKDDVGSSVDRDSITCRGCHIEPDKPSGLLPEPKTWDVYKSPKGFTALKIVDTINNEPSCYTAACHVHPPEQEILGFIEADMSMALLDEALFKQELALTAYVLIFVLAVSLFLGIINYKIVTHPVNELAKGMEQVAKGDLDYSIEISSTDEIGVLSNTFNSMIRDLKTAKEHMENWTQRLEDEVARKTEEIRKTHAGLVQTEKLASLGRMASGMAQEINTPLSKITAHAGMLRKRFPDGSPEADDIDAIIEQAQKCSKIIMNLQTFARAKPPEKTEKEINELMRQILVMVRNQERFQEIDFNIDLSEEPLLVLCDENQFQQICINMLINASDAMPAGGNITVATRKVTEDNIRYAEIEFTDTGEGIRDEDMPKLFEPFFTTKSSDEGTGLGLSVTHGMVKHLGGHIKVKSVLGSGTSFFVRLPLTGGKA